MTEPVVLSCNVRETHIPEDSIEILKHIRPSWTFEPDKIGNKVFTDGITNKLVGFYYNGNKKDTVIVKVYGAMTEIMIDRQKEIDTMKLLQKYKCGPRLYAIFGNGFSYEFVHGSTLTVETCRQSDVFPLVAQEMARMHSSIPLAIDQKESGLWEKMDKFIQLADEVMESDEKIASILAKYGIFPGWGRKAVEEMKTLIISEKMPLAFCHNDILLGNVIYDQSTENVSFIDFEYAMPNYAPFDVANHFNEFAGIENPDFSRCPDKEFRSNWIAAYLSNFQPINEEVVDQTSFERWVDICIPASHLFWALWAIVQAKHSTIDFDFPNYCGQRYLEYVKYISQFRQ